MTGRLLDLTAPTHGRHDGSVLLTSRLAELAEQVRKQVALDPPRPVRPVDPLSSLFEAELRVALVAADADRAFEGAAALLRRTGSSALAHAAIGRALQETGKGWAAGTVSVAQEHRVTATAAAVLARLRSLAPAPAGPTSVVLAVPPGDQHVLALQSLAQLLAEAGHAADVVGDLPVHELAALAASATAVVLSVHVETPALHATLAAVRAAAPRALLVIGGPGAPRTARADLVTSDVSTVAAALGALSGPLSERECEVLRHIADGLSNRDAGAVLGVSAGTVKTHLDHIFAKTGATGRAAAVAMGLRAGWIR